MRAIRGSATRGLAAVAGWDWAVRGVVVLLAILAPVILGEFSLFLLTLILIFGLLAASLDLLVGFTGLPSLGHSAYFGIGGYAAALVAINVTANAFVVLAVAVVFAVLLAVVTGWLAVRARGIYFLMLTLAFAQLLFSLAVTWTPVTGGSNGLIGIPRTSLIPGDDGTPLSGDFAFYYYVLAAVLIGYVLLRKVVGSPFGRALVGIRENEARMRSLGYPVTSYKLASFCIAGALAGYAGGLFVQFERFISPGNVSFRISVLALVMVIVGGVGTLYGALIGAAVVLLLRDELSTRVTEHWELVLGLVFIAIVYFLPRGAAGAIRALKREPGRRTSAMGPERAAAP